MIQKICIYLVWALSCSSAFAANQTSIDQAWLQILRQRISQYSQDPNLKGYWDTFNDIVYDWNEQSSQGRPQKIQNTFDVFVLSQLPTYFQINMAQYSFHTVRLGKSLGIESRWILYNKYLNYISKNAFKPRYQSTGINGEYNSFPSLLIYMISDWGTSSESPSRDNVRELNRLIQAYADRYVTKDVMSFLTTLWIQNSSVQDQDVETIPDKWSPSLRNLKHAQTLYGALALSLDWLQNLSATFFPDPDDQWQMGWTLLTFAKAFPTTVLHGVHSGFLTAEEGLQLLAGLWRIIDESEKEVFVQIRNVADEIGEKDPRIIKNRIRFLFGCEGLLE